MMDVFVCSLRESASILQIGQPQYTVLQGLEKEVEQPAGAVRNLCF